jgi:hypothetical protein
MPPPEKQCRSQKRHIVQTNVLHKIITLWTRKRASTGAFTKITHLYSEPLRPVPAAPEGVHKNETSSKPMADTLAPG